jgi:hypothetical protein
MLFEFLSNLFLVFNDKRNRRELFELIKNRININNTIDIVIFNLTSSYRFDDSINDKTEVQIFNCFRLSPESICSSINLIYINHNKRIYILYDDIDILKHILTCFLTNYADAGLYLDELNEIIDMNIKPLLVEID